MKSKLSMLVLSSHTYPSIRNSKIQKKIFFNQNNNIKEIYWYKQGSKEILQNKNAVLVENDLFINADDSSIGMGLKTIIAFEWMLENSDFNYLFRTNTSSYVSVYNLNQFIENNFQEQEFVYSGLLHSTNDKYKKKIDFASGSGFLLNRKTVELVVEKQDEWDHQYWDDVSLALLLRKYDIIPQQGFRFDVTGNVYKQSLDLKNYHFRCRIDNHYGYPRYLEKYVLIYIHNLFNNVKISKISNLIMSLFFEVSKFFYIQQFTWKLYLSIKTILKATLPRNIYIKIKKIFEEKILSFKLKRFKT